MEKNIEDKSRNKNYSIKGYYKKIDKILNKIKEDHGNGKSFLEKYMFPKNEKKFMGILGNLAKNSNINDSECRKLINLSFKAYNDLTDKIY